MESLSTRKENGSRSIQEPPLMSSSSDPMTERLLCSICLDVFSDPVSTPCGHNFCKICLKIHWNNSEDYRCPNCKETFKQRPDLKINTTLRELVDEHKKKSPEEQPEAEVVCDICTEGKLKAVKSCLVCQISYCETHLESHLRVSGLQKHKLIDPVKNLQDYICQKHDRPLELFCRDDHTCVCLFCTEGDHKNHNTVPLRESELKEMMKENQKAAEKQDVIKDLKEEITELKKRNIEQQQKISNTEDHLLLIQAYKDIQRREAESLEKLEMSKTEITELKKRNNELNLHIQRQEAESLEKLELSKTEITELKKRNNELNLDIQRQEAEITELKKRNNELDVDLESGIELKLKRMQKFAVDVTLDPDTAHPYLILSDDEKQVRTGDIRHKLPDNPKRFDRYVMVLGKEGFSSGRFYYEVQVKGKTNWTLGVARESVDRKGLITLTPVNGLWTVVLRNENEYKAHDGPSVSLSLSVKPQTVGVFVDYEEGLVSFYDVENRSHIYSYTDQSFTEKLYPYFSPSLNYEGKNSEPLIITPVKYTYDFLDV